MYVGTSDWWKKFLIIMRCAIVYAEVFRFVFFHFGVCMVYGGVEHVSLKCWGMSICVYTLHKKKTTSFYDFLCKRCSFIPRFIHRYIVYMFCNKMKLKALKRIVRYIRFYCIYYLLQTCTELNKKKIQL